MKTLLTKLRLYLRLTRFDRPVGSLLLLWPTLWALWLAAAANSTLGNLSLGNLTYGIPPIKELCIFITGTFLMRSAGCAINDAADAQFDAHVARTADRVVATGEVSRREAIYVGLVLAGVSGSLLFFLKPAVWPWAFVAVAVAFCYPFCKRFFPIPQLILGVAFSMGIPLAYAAILGYVPVQAAWVFAANFCWIVAYDTAYAMADKPDDLKIGIRTSAIFFGKYDAVAIFVFQTAFIALWANVLWQSKLGNAAWIALVIAMGLILSHIKPLFSRDRDACLRVFLANNRVGFVVWLGLALALLV